MTYNVKFGGGRIDFFFDCHGDRVLMTESETLRNLQGIAEKIRAASPAVVFLQEVDVLSKRAAYLDQLQWLLDHSELNYAVYASQWRSDYVPSDGLGPVDSGNAILSLYPLSDVVRLALPLRGDQDALTQYFYLKRNILKARVRVGDSSVVLLNTHTSAYSQDGTKHTQLQRFESEMTSASDEGSWVIGGGDLNAIPPGSVDTHNFADAVCEGDYEASDYRGEEDWLAPLYERFASAIPLDDYQADNGPYFSHSTSSQIRWNRKLDYLFTNGQFLQGLVHQDSASGGQDTMPLSDHAPISAELVLP